MKTSTPHWKSMQAFRDYPGSARKPIIGPLTSLFLKSFYGHSDEELQSPAQRTSPPFHTRSLREGPSVCQPNPHNPNSGLHSCIGRTLVLVLERCPHVQGGHNVVVEIHVGDHSASGHPRLDPLRGHTCTSVPFEGRIPQLGDHANNDIYCFLNMTYSRNYAKRTQNRSLPATLHPSFQSGGMQGSQ